ncbi:hypothetical protein J6590_003562 [Homalodisca vitripennis]|nr:hypothetical protein J6590_003562 [Homalodisca vitripennis]
MGKNPVRVIDGTSRSFLHKGPQFGPSFTNNYFGFHHVYSVCFCSRLLCPASVGSLVELVVCVTVLLTSLNTVATRRSVTRSARRGPPAPHNLGDEGPFTSPDRPHHFHFLQSSAALKQHRTIVLTSTPGEDGAVVFH